MGSDRYMENNSPAVLKAQHAAVVARMRELEATLDKATTFTFGELNGIAVQVVWRGEESWGVVRGGVCLSVDGEWSYESLPSNRTEEFLATHRFTRDEAIRLAKEVTQDA